MSKTRRSGGSFLDKRVIDLHNEGWHAPNIASIAKIDIQTVKEVLQRHKLILD
ncbi:MAG: hypothetical protein IJV24_07205 [Prevotella sp.]|nr:hypothetical protein [Prevotella sp.]